MILAVISSLSLIETFIYLDVSTKMLESIFFLLLLTYITNAVRVDHGNPSAFEGDIGLDPFTRDYVNGKLSPDQAYKGVYQDRIWPGGRVPYVFDRNFDSRRRTLMNRAFEEYNQKTCIRFHPRQNERAYVLMVNQNACWSIIGRNGGRQLLKMGGHCLQLGTAVHELMHAVGFYHEQSRYDRDKYVKIFWNNIQRGEDYNFQKYRSNYYGQSYDLNSIMHYRNNEFGAWGKTTIQSIKNPNLRLGNTRFSQTDINAINRMYGCSGTGGITPTPGTGGTGDCKDNKPDCVGWAKNGYCTATQAKHSEIMKTDCCHSCKQPYAKCGNENNGCDRWSNEGECEKNPNYMWRNCPRACKLCT